MKQMLGLFTSICLCFTLAAQPAGTNNRIDSLLNYLKNNNAFSGAVNIQKGNTIMYAGDFNKFPAGTSKYRVGSVSKMYTALIIYQLIDEKKLDLNTTIEKYFPAIKNAAQITIANLLSHTSGIFNITEMKNYYTTRTRRFSRAQVLGIINENKPAFKPNSDCYYSNTNYILLGYIIEDVTGKTYAQNLQDRISIPFNLKNTFCEDSLSNRQLREQSYKFNGETWKVDTDSDPSLPFAAGAVVSTATEMCQMIRHLFNKEIISDSSLTVMKKLKNKSTGHGIFKAPFYDKEGWGHTGRIDEFRAFAGYFPGDSVSIAITANGLNMKLNDIIIGVLSVYYGRDYTFPQFIHSNIEQPAAAHFVGKYEAKALGLITLGRFRIKPAGKNYLFMTESTDSTESETQLLERRDAFTFYARDIDGELVFWENDNGKVVGVKMKQGKTTIKCKKTN